MPTIPNVRADCLAMHMGLWAVEPRWFLAAFQTVRAGGFRPVAREEFEEEAPAEQMVAKSGNVGVVRIVGQMQKGMSKFGGTSTVATRKALRAMRDDAEVDAVVLQVDSPGGTVAGTAELADEVAATNKAKPVLAQVDDLGASAAYWVASQARSIRANRTAMVGSIGTIAVVEDLSGMAEAEGVKVHVVATGKFKGAGVPGTEVTDEMLAEWQSLVDAANNEFVVAVTAGRKRLSAEDVLGLEARVLPPNEALKARLIDAIGPFEETLAEARDLAAAARQKRAAARSRRVALAGQ